MEITLNGKITDVDDDITIGDCTGTMACIVSDMLSGAMFYVIGDSSMA